MWKKVPQFVFDIAQKLVPLPQNYGKSAGGLYVPASNLHSWSGAVGWSTIPGNPEVFPEMPVEPPYEVNMVEALVGWKSWGYDEENKTLETRGHEWPKDFPITAACTEFHGGKEVAVCGEIPNEAHSCGIYAADERVGAQEYYDDGDIIGMVYGWGRYIRGNSGWRAQLAYPKCFYLKNSQASLIEWLRLYHVPIFIEQPTLIYNPEEDGYEYRGEEADGDCRTFEESAPTKEDDPDY